MLDLSIWPEVASANAERIDLLYILMLVFSGAIILLVAGLVIGFSIRYRRGTPRSRAPLPAFLSREIETGWTLATLFLAVIIFLWALEQDTYFLKPPPESLEIQVVAKQWMWKVYHDGGQRELNELHVPRGRDVTLLLSSRDVIHSFYLPAFRVKQDVLPGRTERLWFKADKTGSFHLFCAEFCGSEHSQMIGRVVVMEPEAYARWLTAQGGDASLAARGEQLFQSLGCAGCHVAGAGEAAPDLQGLYGRRVLLQDGREIEADRPYLRDSILQPKRALVAGYRPIMPSFDGILEEDEVAALVAYVSSLGAGGEAER